MNGAQIIELSTFRAKAGERPKASPSPLAQRLRVRREKLAARAAAAPPDETETGKNFRLRQQRRDEWMKADALREYWKAAREMDSAIHRAQNQELPEGNLHPPSEMGSCWPLIAKWRAAIIAQLLTPAPTAREIEWKRAVFKHGDHEHTDVKPERIERAIADDVEFLRTHPTRISGKWGMDPENSRNGANTKPRSGPASLNSQSRTAFPKASSLGLGGSSTKTLRRSPIATS